MSKFFSDQHLTLTGVQCGHQFQETVARLETSPPIPCRACAVVTHSEASQFRSGLAEADQAIDDLVKSLRKLGQS